MIKMPDSDYFAHPNLNNSGFKTFLKSPALYSLRRTLRTTAKSKALIDGSAVHMLSLEPHLFTRSYAVWQGTFTSKEGKEFKKTNEAKGLTVVKQEDVQAYEDMAQTLIHCLKLDEVPEDRKEVVELANICGVPCKGKADFIGNDGYIWDIKTIAGNITIRDGVWHEMFQLNYDLQAMWYLLVFNKIKPKGFKFALISKAAPYDLTTYEVPVEILERAKIRIKEGLADFKACLEADDFSGLNTQMLKLPHYLQGE
jgi:hypothetical protein